MPQPSIYGLPATSVESPDGEVTLYPVQPAPSSRWEWRAWSVTSPKGDLYRVAEMPDGNWECTCPASMLGKNRGGKWQTIRVRGVIVPVCKHVFSVHQLFGGTQS